MKTPHHLFKWAVTDTWDFRNHASVNFMEYDNAKEYAKTQSIDSQLPVYIWKLTPQSSGKPIKWMEVS